MATVDKYDNFLSNLRGTSTSSWTEAQESSLLESYSHITAHPGEEIQGKLIESFNFWLNVPKDKLAVIKRVVDFLHNGCLLINDIKYDSQLRRGIPVAHKIYGIPQTINTANYVYCLANHRLLALRPVRRRASISSSSSDSGLSDDSATVQKADYPDRIIPDRDLDLLVAGELLSLHRGQGMDILWSDTLRCPTEDEYVDMVKDKTGSLLRIAIKLMMACATRNTNVDYIPLTDLIGVQYQIRNDYMNLQSNEYMDEDFAKNLSEGKFSFPIVHGILEQPENRQIMNVLQKRPKTPTLKRHTINYLRDTTKSFDYTLTVIRKLERQVKAEIARLGGNPMLSAMMDVLSV
ncbi:terpenoid synthase [Suillus decipiens]|nr:terpenoid synthase [Suillus decipiens]